MTNIPCAVELDKDHPRYGWLYLPQADGQLVTAFLLEDSDLRMLRFWLERQMSEAVAEQRARNR